MQPREENFLFEILPQKRHDMAVAHNGFILALLAFVSCVSCEISVLDDPTSLPGHLQPLGTGRPITEVVEVPGFPEPDGEII